jgi:dihydroorotate dehydrogenase (NAD+) catalytic subunit
VKPSSVPIAVFGTTFQNPILLAAGTAGFGSEVAGVIDLDRLGGIVTKAVSVEPRLGHPAPRLAEFAGGMMNAVGLANPGIDFVAETALPWLEQHLKAARVIVNVVGLSAERFAQVVARLDERSVVTAFELNVSCPNTARGNEEFASDIGVLTDLVQRCRGRTRKPLIVKLAPNQPDLEGTAEACAAVGADGFALVNTIPGTLFWLRDGRDMRATRLGFGKGGISGPALLPVGVLATRRVHDSTGLPIVGLGGVRTIEDVDQYLVAGASLVGVGSAALADPRVPQRLAAAWSARG